MERIEKEAAIKKRRDYITFVTDEISTHAADLGIALCMPHVITKDILKRLTEHSDKIGLIVKDKRNIIIKPEELEILHFEIENPLPKYMLDILFAKEAFFVCWKNGENEQRPVEEVLTGYVNFMGMPQPTKDEEADPDVKLPPILKSLPLELTPEQYDELLLNVNVPDEVKEQSAPNATENAAINPEGELTETDTVEVTTDEVSSTQLNDPEGKQTNSGEEAIDVDEAVENVEGSKPEEVGEETQSENQNNTNPENTQEDEVDKESPVISDENEKNESPEDAKNQNEITHNENGNVHPKEIGHGSSEESRGSVVTIIENVAKI